MPKPDTCQCLQAESCRKSARLAEICALRPVPTLVELPRIACPAWAGAERIGELFGLSPCHLRRLVEVGEVRKRKMGHDHRATALYSCFDVLEWLECGEPWPADDAADLPKEMPCKSKV